MIGSFKPLPVEALLNGGPGRGEAMLNPQHTPPISRVLQYGGERSPSRRGECERGVTDDPAYTVAVSWANNGTRARNDLV